MLTLPRIITFSCVLILFTLSSCQKYTLRAHTEYVSIQDLASYQVGTPDPMLCNPPTGQRLMVYWKIPSILLEDTSLQLSLTIRFCNHQEIRIKLPVEKTRGTYCYTLINEDYTQDGGIRTYKILLEGSRGTYECLRHLLWRDLITIHSSDKIEENSPEEGESDEYEDDEENF